MSLFESASLVVTPNGYKENKLYSIKPTDGSGDLVVTRATSATRVNSDGLIEVTPYNLLQRSEQFDNAYWSKLASSISANSITSPNNTITADKLIEDTSASAHRFISTSFATTSGTSYSVSIFLKRAEREYAYIRLNNSGGDIIAANINLLNGTVSQLIFGDITIVPYNNDWYRVVATGTSISTSNGSFEVRISNSPTYANYTGDGTSGIYIWGAQLVTGTSAKEYFPTTDRLDVPRLDYSNGSCPSILVEPQRTNLVLRSEEFNLIWSQINATITANVTTAPDGTSTADKLVENATNNQHRIDQTTTNAIGTNTFSVFAKKSERDSIWLRVGTSGAYFDLTNGTASGVIGVTTSIVNYGNGWYKCSIVRTSTVANEVVRINSAIGINGTYLGDGTSGLFIWGAQLEAGSYPTSYIPTTTASVTRNADVISKTGISSLIGQTEGTIFADFNKTKNNLSILSIDDGTANNRIFIEGTGTSTGLRVRVINGGTTTVDNTSNVLQNGINKIALVYANNNVSLYRNGVLIFNDNSATIPNTSILRIGSNVTNLFQLDDSVNSAVLWKTALTDQECINLTTL
jgi:hypothetical protein